MEPNKKTKQADLEKFKGFFFNLGLSLSLGLVLFAFEYKTYDESRPISIPLAEENIEPLLDIPITVHTPPPPPKKQPIIKEMEDYVEIETSLEHVIDIEIADEPMITDIAIPLPKLEEADEIFEVVEAAPTPVGGMEQWNIYLRKNLKYPSQAKRMGIEGTVYISFVVNTDGTIQDASLLRGIGAGCDEEALRVIQNAPNWNPGKQRGRPVRVRMSLPIRFKLY